MCDKLKLLTKESIEEAIRLYSISEEKQETTNYFKYKNRIYPTMRIVKNAINYNPNIKDEKLYDNIKCCEKVIKKLLIDVVFLGAK